MEPSKRLRLITNSEQKVRRRCAREHHFAYELGYRSVQEDAEALRFGTLIHTALEAWWKAPRSLRLANALAALPLGGDPFTLALATEMLHGYTLRWADAPLEALLLPGGKICVEVEFRAPLVNPITSEAARFFELGGKMDALVLNHEDGQPYIIEHKTSSEDISAGSTYWQALRIDSQISTYYAGARALGFECAGVIYDVLGKPKHRPLQATPVDARKYKRDGTLYANQRERDETPQEFGLRLREAIASRPDTYYRRGVVVRLSEEEREAAWDTWQTARGIREDGLAEQWARNPDRCKRTWGMCPYFGVCTHEAELTDTRLFTKVEHVHTELARPAPEAANGVIH